MAERNVHRVTGARAVPGAALGLAGPALPGFVGMGNPVGPSRRVVSDRGRGRWHRACNRDQLGATPERTQPLARPGRQETSAPTAQYTLGRAGDHQGDFGPETQGADEGYAYRPTARETIYVIIDPLFHGGADGRGYLPHFTDLGATLRARLEAAMLIAGAAGQRGTDGNAHHARDRLRVLTSTWLATCSMAPCRVMATLLPCCWVLRRDVVTGVRTPHPPLQLCDPTR